MKKLFTLLTSILLVSLVFITSGCETKSDTLEISYENGNGIFKLSVPKKIDEQGNEIAKYEFTKIKPKELSTPATFYLETDKAVFGFSTSGMTYNTSKDYKAKYGDTKATFDGYLEFIEDSELFNKNYLPGLEQFEINGRKALRYYNRVGGSGNYKYYGYFYFVGADDIYPGSRVGITVNYKTDNKPTKIKEFDEETLAIIKSLKLEPKMNSK